MNINVSEELITIIKNVHRFSKGYRVDLRYSEGSKHGFPKKVKPNLLFEVKTEM